MTGHGPASAATKRHSPLVSLVMANHNGARYLEASVASALAQTGVDLELIVIDDASDDHSMALLSDAMSRDTRMRVERMAHNAGPAAARNRGFAIARGAWIAVVDADDLLHPERTRRLLDAAGDADIVADDLLVFDERRKRRAHALIGRRAATLPHPIDAISYVRANQLEGPGPSLGYLKPMFRAATLSRFGITYSERLRIAEDYDFVLRLLLGGAVFKFIPELTYFYRKHAESVSHRLHRHNLEPMLLADDLTRASFKNGMPSKLRRALDRRRRGVNAAIVFDDLVMALKSGRSRAVIDVVRRHPTSLVGLRTPILARLRRLYEPADSPEPEVRRPLACVISRQRVTGAVNGSSAYLLNICGTLRDDGFDVRLVSPSPLTFGRWPCLALRPEMTVFEDIAVRGSLRVGDYVIATDPRVAARALLTILDRLAGRIGMTSGQSIAKAAYAIASPWTSADFLYVAQHARGADLIVADYAFQTAAIPYVLSPQARSLVIMHDAFSNMPAEGSVARIDVASEMRLLDGAEIVLAIQAKEADLVRRHFKDKPVFIAPMLTRPSPHPQPGSDGKLLFVASDTTPNRAGLQWFLEQVWPSVKSALPDAQLLVAGSVAAGVSTRAPGVQFLGCVDDLSPLYAAAGIVISPLRTGTGLKIKLVEALARGKAIVATSVTLEGVEQIVLGAVVRADEPAAFSDAIVRLSRNADTRADLGTRAIAVAARHFAADKRASAWRRYVGSTTIQRRETCPRNPDIDVTPVSAERAMEKVN